MQRQELGSPGPDILPRLFIGHEGSVEKEDICPENREEHIKRIFMRDMLTLEKPSRLRKETT